jgi:hypothetical protein
VLSAIIKKPGPLPINIVRFGKAVDLREAKTIAMVVRATYDSDVVISKTNNDFDIISPKKGKVSVIINDTDLSKPGNYKAQIQVNYENGDVCKSDVFDLFVI